METFLIIHANRLWARKSDIDRAKGEDLIIDSCRLKRDAIRTSIVQSVIHEERIQGLREDDLFGFAQVNQELGIDHVPGAAGINGNQLIDGAFRDDDAVPWYDLTLNEDFA